MDIEKQRKAILQAREAAVHAALVEQRQWKELISAAKPNGFQHARVRRSSCGDANERSVAFSNLGALWGGAAASDLKAWREEPVQVKPPKKHASSPKADHAPNLEPTFVLDDLWLRMPSIDAIIAARSRSVMHADSKAWHGDGQAQAKP